MRGRVMPLVRDLVLDEDVQPIERRPGFRWSTRFSASAPAWRTSPSTAVVAASPSHVVPCWRRMRVWTRRAHAGRSSSRSGRVVIRVVRIDLWEQDVVEAARRDEAAGERERRKPIPSGSRYQDRRTRSASTLARLAAPAEPADVHRPVDHDAEVEAGRRRSLDDADPALGALLEGHQPGPAHWRRSPTRSSMPRRPSDALDLPVVNSLVEDPAAVDDEGLSGDER